MRKIITLSVVLLLVFAVPSCEKSRAKCEIGGFEYVDLGLSVKWATCNVGATKPEEYGSFFAGGGVKGQVYDGSSFSGGGFGIIYPDYQLDSCNNLKPECDAAHVNLGSSWRMPTKTEWEELVNNCTWTCTNNYCGTGVSGNIITSKKVGYTDKSIFLPAAGFSEGRGLLNASYCGYYWSSTVNGKNAWNVFFDAFVSGGVCIKFSYRSCGMPVRPVSE